MWQRRFSAVTAAGDLALGDGENIPPGHQVNIYGADSATGGTLSARLGGTERIASSVLNIEESADVVHRNSRDLVGFFLNRTRQVQKLVVNVGAATSAHIVVEVQAPGEGRPE